MRPSQGVSCSDATSISRHGPLARAPDLWPDVHNSLITAIRDALDAGSSSLFRRRRVAHDGPDRTGLDRIYRPDVTIRRPAIDAAERPAWPCWSVPR